MLFPQVPFPTSSSFTQEVETALESFDFLNCSDLDEDDEEEKEDEQPEDEQQQEDEGEKKEEDDGQHEENQNKMEEEKVEEEDEEEKDEKNFYSGGRSVDHHCSISYKQRAFTQRRPDDESRKTSPYCDYSVFTHSLLAL